MCTFFYLFYVYKPALPSFLFHVFTVFTFFTFKNIPFAFVYICCICKNAFCIFTGVTCCVYVVYHCFRFYLFFTRLHFFLSFILHTCLFSCSQCYYLLYRLYRLHFPLIPPHFILYVDMFAPFHFFILLTSVHVSLPFFMF